MRYIQLVLRRSVLARSRLYTAVDVANTRALYRQVTTARIVKCSLPFSPSITFLNLTWCSQTGNKMRLYLLPTMSLWSYSIPTLCFLLQVKLKDIPYRVTAHPSILKLIFERQFLKPYSWEPSLMQLPVISFLYISLFHLYVSHYFVFVHPIVFFLYILLSTALTFHITSPQRWQNIFSPRQLLLHPHFLQHLFSTHASDT